MYILEQSFLILGASRSGKSVAEYLIKNNCKKCYIFEQSLIEKIQKNLEELSNIGVKVISNDQVDKVLDAIDVLVLSPGVPINHPIAVKAKELGKRIIGELEFAYSSFIPPIIAVTGTNGKTTTVSLIEEIFKSSNKQAKLFGNVGVPFSEGLESVEKNEVYILEVSSFQLESTYAFCPHVSCVLNLTPDHLDRHYSMENYAFLKKKIFKNQRESEFVVLNYDDPLVRNFKDDTKAKIIWVSTKEKVEGAYLYDRKLYYNDQFIIDQDALAIKGEHNVYNALFSIVCACLFGIDVDSIRQALSGFKGVKNRLELVGEVDGVKYINDSKATNTGSTISAIETLITPTILILGGFDKKEDYTALFERIKTAPIKHVVLTGDTRFKMVNTAGNIGFSDLTITSDFDFAVKISSMMASSGDVVLLSPACSSFDHFTSYEERGERFRKIVESLSEKSNLT